MSHWHRIPVHRVATLLPSFFRRQVRDDLVPVKIEVYPLVRAAAFGAAEQLAVEAACRAQVVHREGEMKERNRAHTAGVSAGPASRKPAPVRGPALSSALGGLLALSLVLGASSCADQDQIVAQVAQTPGSWRLLLALLLGFALSFLGSLPMTGPLALLVLDRTVSGQRRSAFWIALAGALVEGLIAAVIAALLPLVLRYSTSIVRIARVSGAVVIFVVGLSLVLRPQTVTQLETTHKGQSLLAGFLATALNPTLLATWTIAVTALHANGLLDGGFRAGPVFGVGVVVGVLGWFLVLVALARVGTPERMNRYRSALGRSVGGILLLVSVLTFLHLAFP
jgi:threonine/homoserine/homoserine lactone efflux protein